MIILKELYILVSKECIVNNKYGMIFVSLLNACGRCSLKYTIIDIEINTNTLNRVINVLAT